MAQSPGFIRAAFLAPANLLLLGAAGLASWVMGEPTPMLFALGAEGLYLGLWSSSGGLRRAVRARGGGGDPERLDDKDPLLVDLSPSQREHYQHLVEIREQILINYRKLPGGRVIAASSERQVDALLTSFLRLLNALNGQRKFLGAADRAAVKRDVTELERELQTEANERLREAKQRRLEILKKREERFEQAEESREVVSHQLAGIEDLLRLTLEQSIAIRDPDLVTHQLDALTAETQATESTVRDMERFLQLSEEAKASIPHGTRVR